MEVETRLDKKEGASTKTSANSPDKAVQDKKKRQIILIEVEKIQE